jgi:hypothetical protein
MQICMGKDVAYHTKAGLNNSHRAPLPETLWHLPCSLVGVDQEVRVPGFLAGESFQKRL